MIQTRTLESISKTYNNRLRDQSMGKHVLLKITRATVAASILASCVSPIATTPTEISTRPPIVILKTPTTPILPEPTKPTVLAPSSEPLPESIWNSINAGEEVDPAIAPNAEVRISVTQKLLTSHASELPEGIKPQDLQISVQSNGKPGNDAAWSISVHTKDGRSVVFYNKKTNAYAYNSIPLELGNLAPEEAKTLGLTVGGVGAEEAGNWVLQVMPIPEELKGIITTPVFLWDGKDGKRPLFGYASASGTPLAIFNSTTGKWEINKAAVAEENTGYSTMQELMDAQPVLEVDKAVRQSVQDAIALYSYNSKIPRYTVERFTKGPNGETVVWVKYADGLFAGTVTKHANDIVTYFAPGIYAAAQKVGISGVTEKAGEMLIQPHENLLGPILEKTHVKLKGMGKDGDLSLVIMVKTDTGVPIDKIHTYNGSEAATARISTDGQKTDVVTVYSNGYFQRNLAEQKKIWGGLITDASIFDYVFWRSFGVGNSLIGAVSVGDPLQLDLLDASGKNYFDSVFGVDAPRSRAFESTAVTSRPDLMAALSRETPQTGDDALMRELGTLLEEQMKKDMKSLDLFGYSFLSQ